MFQRALRLCLIVPLAAISSCGNSTNGTGTNDCKAGLFPGDLVITEVMANPTATDTGNEWFELYNPSDKPRLLGGVQVVSSKADGSVPKIHVISALTIAPRSYAALGDIAEAAKPAWITYSYGKDLGGLQNTSGALTLRCNDKVIDKVTWEPATSAKSRGFDGAQAPDAIANDNVMKWCDATTDFNVDFKGTPGMANDKCDVVTGVEKGFCIDPVTMKPRSVVAPAVGDLVISEIMADPTTADPDGEWIEITATKAVDLAGLGVGTIDDATRLKPVLEARANCLPLGVGERVVVARPLDEARNGGIKPGARVLTLPVELTNSGGVVTIGTGTTLLLDRVPALGMAKSGVSRSLHPLHITTADNDLPRFWCDGVMSYGPGGAGSPGGENPPCNIPPAPGNCREAGAERPLVTPAVGDLVISEVMGNPITNEADSEWIEITATRAVDLIGLTVGNEADPARLKAVAEAAAGDCLALGPGERAVLVKSLDALKNGGIAAGPRVLTLPGISLGNTMPFALVIGSAGALIDVIPMTPAANKSGISLALDPMHMSATDNDVVRFWCDGSVAYGAGGSGTPGGANAACDIPPAPGMCRDGGVERPLVSPVMGDVFINELMADPSLAADADGEWFELRVNTDFDLNGITFGSSKTQTLSMGQCLRVARGSHVVFARSTDPMLNGGLVGLQPWQAITGGTFVNGGGTITLSLGISTLDTLVWPAAKAGIAYSHDPNPPNAWCNLDPAKHMKEQFNGTDYGTPGAVNTSCP